METLLIDIGALAMFLGFMAIVYWHGVTQEAPPSGRQSNDDASESSESSGSGAAGAPARVSDRLSCPRGPGQRCS